MLPRKWCHCECRTIAKLYHEYRVVLGRKKDPLESRSFSIVRNYTQLQVLNSSSLGAIIVLSALWIILFIHLFNGSIDTRHHEGL